MNQDGSRALAPDAISANAPMRGQPRPASLARPPSPPPLLAPSAASVAAPASVAPELAAVELELLPIELAAVPLLVALLVGDDELLSVAWRSGLPLPISVLCPHANIAASEIMMKETASTRPRACIAPRPPSVAPASTPALR